MSKKAAAKRRKDRLILVIREWEKLSADTRRAVAEESPALNFIMKILVNEKDDNLL